MVKGDVYNGFKSYFDILEKVGQYSSADTARLVLAAFIQELKGSGYYYTLSDADKKAVDAVEQCIQKKLCITPYSSTCFKKKADKIFRGDYEACIFHNDEVSATINRNPVWEDDGYSCELDTDGYQTGKKIVSQHNTNPNSDADTRTTLITDTTACVINSPRWIKTGSQCMQIPIGSSTGNSGMRIDNYANINPNYLGPQTKTETVEDTTTCPIPNTDPFWSEISRTCETTTYQHSADPSAPRNTGKCIFVFRDTNIYSSTYNTTRTRPVTPSSLCPITDVGYLTFGNGLVLYEQTVDHTARTITIPYILYKNNVAIQDTSVLSLNGTTGYTAVFTETDIVITVPKNTTGIDREIRFSLEEEISHTSIVAVITQTGDAVFTWEGGATTKTVSNVLAAGQTFQSNVISLAGDVPLGFTVDTLQTSPTLTVQKTGSSITVTVPENTENSPKVFTVVLNQNNSGNSISMTINQLAASVPVPDPVYVFAFSDSGNVSLPNTAGTATVYVISTKDGIDTEYTIVSDTFSGSGRTVSITNGNVVITVPANSLNVPVTGTVTLRQTEKPSNTLTVNIQQAAGEVPVYVFTWEDDTDYLILDGGDAVIGAGDTVVISGIKSTYGSQPVGYYLDYTTGEFLHPSLTPGGILQVTVDENYTKNTRDGVVRLKQNGSLNMIRLEVHQDGSSVENYQLRVTTVLLSGDVTLDTFIDDVVTEEYDHNYTDGDSTVYIYIPKYGYFMFTSSDALAKFDIDGQTYYSGQKAFISDDINEITISH